MANSVRKKINATVRAAGLQLLCCRSRLAGLPRSFLHHPAVKAESASQEGLQKQELKHSDSRSLLPFARRACVVSSCDLLVTAATWLNASFNSAADLSIKTCNCCSRSLADDELTATCCCISVSWPVNAASASREKLSTFSIHGATPCINAAIRTKGSEHAAQLRAQSKPHTDLQHGGTCVSRQSALGSGTCSAGVVVAHQPLNGKSKHTQDLAAAVAGTVVLRQCL
jgi:hypothetical protein